MFLKVWINIPSTIAKNFFSSSWVFWFSVVISAILKIFLRFIISSSWLCNFFFKIVNIKKKCRVVLPQFFPAPLPPSHYQCSRTTIFLQLPSPRIHFYYSIFNHFYSPLKSFNTIEQKKCFSQLHNVHSKLVSYMYIYRDKAVLKMLFI